MPENIFTKNEHLTPEEKPKETPKPRTVSTPTADKKGLDGPFTTEIRPSTSLPPPAQGSDVSDINQSLEPAIQAAPKPNSNPLGQTTNSPAAPDSETLRIATAIQDLVEAEEEPNIELKSNSTTPLEQKPSTEPSSKLNSPKTHTPSLNNDDQLRQRIAEAIALEDERSQTEHSDREQIHRQRSFDEARIRALVDKQLAQGAASNGGGAMGGGGHKSGHGEQQNLSPLLLKTESNPISAAVRNTPFEKIADAEIAQKISTPHKTRQQVIQLSVERLREISRDRQLEHGKLNLTIHLDESAQIKMVISPRGDGSHQLALLIANPKLRHELQRSEPELKSAAAELPIDISDIIIGPVEELDLKDHKHD